MKINKAVRLFIYPEHQDGYSSKLSLMMMQLVIKETWRNKLA